MKYDYKEIDQSIATAVAELGPISFDAIWKLARVHATKIATDNSACPWRIVERRVQSMRKAGKIKHNRSARGWVSQ